MPSSKLRRRAMLACALLLAVACAPALGGCIKSDTITQKIYENNDEYPIDETMPKTLVNDQNAEETTEDLPKIDTDSKSDRKDETVKTAAVYRATDTNSDAPVALPVAANNNSEVDAKSEESDEERQNESEAKSASTTGEKTKSDKGSGKSKKKTKKKKSKEKDEDSDENPAEVAKEAKEYVVELGDDAVEIPEGIARVAAVGNAAVIVSMLGGSADGTPLVAADEEFVKANKTVMAARGVSGDVAALWSDDGSEEEDMTGSSFKKLTGTAKPDLVVYPTDADPLSDKQIVTLKKKKVLVWAVDMTSYSSILSAVTTLGQTLADGGNALAQDRTDAYVEFHNEVIDAFADMTSSSKMHTVYISDWDPDARFANKDFDSSHGVGIAQLGSKASPLCYYLGKAGLTNTAATGSKFKDAKASRKSVVWQFKANYAACKVSDFTKLDTDKATFDLTGGSGFDNALLYSTRGGAFTEEFPGVIVASQEMRTKYLLPDMKTKNGLYHPYSTVDAGRLGTVVGYKPKNTTYESAIGFVSGESTSTLYDEDDTLDTSYTERVHVNPHGLYCSWTDGSVESVLEVPWAYAAVVTGGDENAELGTSVAGCETAADVTGYFYREFYGYEDFGSDDLDTVFSGLKKVGE